MFCSVIIPAYNEAIRIKDTLDNIVNIDEIDEIIVVDDGSSDGTFDILSSYKSDKVKSYKQPKNAGKGKALERGIELLSARSEIVVFLDADVGSTSSEVIKIVKPVLDNECDVAIAKFRPAKKKGGMGFVKRLAKDSVFEMTGVSLDSTISGQR